MSNDPFAGLTVWPAKRLGFVVHVNPLKPERRLFVPPAMALPPAKRAKLRVAYRHAAEPLGGVWSKTARTLPPLFPADTTGLFHPSMAANFIGWQLFPEPDAAVLVMDAATVAGAFARWRYPSRPFGVPELDYRQIAAEGIAGIYAPPERLTPWISTFPPWIPCAVLWLRWCFVGEPARLLMMSPEEQARRRARHQRNMAAWADDPFRGGADVAPAIGGPFRI